MEVMERVAATGMGAVLLEDAVSFRVWAPHADRVSVVGSFNDWSADASEMQRDEKGCWFTEVKNAKAGDEYKFQICNGDQTFERIDPYAREVTNSVGNAVVHDPEFDWADDDFKMPNHNELVIYEMHIGTFNRTDPDQPGDFADAIKRLGHLKKLGVNAIEIMPVAEFAGDWSWGYNPAHIFAIEQAYGGPDALKRFVKAAHAEGLAVIMDVVYNHFGPSDLDLWQFDGWSENGGGGIYFYNDWRSTTPWGETRPDYGRGEVRQFIFDNAMMWLNEYRVDGLRYDMTAYIRKVNGIDASDIPEGWSLMQWINGEVANAFPGKLLVAEDLQGDPYLTQTLSSGGAGFSTQWDAHFVHPVRDVVQQVEDDYRDMHKIRDALQFRYNDDAFQRVIYSESHDEIANGKSRVPEEITPGEADSYHAQKLSTVAAALALTAPGIPMLMQGQEFVEDLHFDDADPLDWDRAEQFRGITRLYRDLISLRLNENGISRGLVGQHINVHHVNDGDKVVAFHRWCDGGAGDDVVVLVNFADRSWDHYQIGFPSEGTWRLRLNSDWTGYSDDFCDHPVSDVVVEAVGRDGYPANGTLSFGPYAILILSKEPGDSDANDSQTGEQE
ncbi:alpha-amylase family glycosyl hydrolase [Mariniblastus fucicola]|uniref:1,4-alpha-glucan branching enzyme n=1 Tax=Mariniblastus fucicola TaxID=980251 RepID=A0A5B9PMQ0_9BACT|nr:alpha-amylase family glycosyl hydrolase [Mariniblastus fucicola]QEG23861.1 1,4-alpha-glucan branching enzyme GlgB [Mariniblastus fucicola]